MKIKVGNYYLNTRGEIVLIDMENNSDITVYPYMDTYRSYTSEGKYSTIDSEYDLLLEIPKDKYKAFIEGLIND